LSIINDLKQVIIARINNSTSGLNYLGPDFYLPNLPVNCLAITYNVLNLQQSLSQNGTTVASYTWLADGTKCAVVDNTTNGYDYLGSLIYNRSGSVRTLESAAFGGGRFVNTNNTILPYYYITDHLGSTRVITDNSGSVVERNDYYPFGGKHANSGYAQLTTNKQKFNGKELQTTGNTGFLDYRARMYDDVIGRWGVVDPMAEKYYNISSYVYCANNPVSLIDPNGRETRVAMNNDGTYRVVGGELNKDRNIYIYTQDKEGNYTVKGGSIGITTSTTSFYNADANDGKGAWAVGSIINPNDKSGDNFLGNIFGNTPTMVDDYMANAGNGGKYDFKVTNGTDEPIPGIDPYRGMPIGKTGNGQNIVSSARDIGNIAAGYVAGANGMSWVASRIAFDAFQSKVKGQPSIESISTRNAEYYGWRIGSNITPTQKANNLLKSLWNWITK